MITFCKTRRERENMRGRSHIIHGPIYLYLWLGGNIEGIGGCDSIASRSHEELPDGDREEARVGPVMVCCFDGGRIARPLRATQIRHNDTHSKTPPQIASQRGDLDLEIPSVGHFVSSPLIHSMINSSPPAFFLHIWSYPTC